MDSNHERAGTDVPDVRWRVTHRDARLDVERVGRGELAQEVAQARRVESRVVLLIALAQHAHRRDRVVLDQPGVDRVLEDAPQVIAQVASHFRRSRLDCLERHRQLEPRDRRDASTLEGGQQVLLDLASALHSGACAQRDAGRFVPLPVHRFEALLRSPHVVECTRLARSASRMHYPRADLRSSSRSARMYLIPRYRASSR